MSQRTSSLIFWQGELLDVRPDDEARPDSKIEAVEIRPLGHVANTLAHQRTFDRGLLKFFVGSAMLHIALMAAAALTPGGPQSSSEPLLNVPDSPLRGLRTAAMIHETPAIPSSTIDKKDGKPFPKSPPMALTVPPNRKSHPKPASFKTVIRKAMKDASPQIHRCINGRNSEQGNKLVIEFHIAYAKVTQASVDVSQSSLANQEIRACVVNVIKALRFPELKRFTGANIRYPLLINWAD